MRKRVCSFGWSRNTLQNWGDRSNPGLGFTMSSIDVSLSAGVNAPRPLSKVSISAVAPSIYDPSEFGLAGRGVEMAMIDEIYNRRVLELAADIPRLGRLPAPDATAKAHSRLCGSTVVVDLCVKDGRVVDFAHDVRACALGQASSSLMARHVVGSTAEELLELRDAMTRMLKANGPPPVGKWSEFAVLEPVRDYKARHASTLLTFEAVADALSQIAAREGATAPASA